MQAASTLLRRSFSHLAGCAVVPETNQSRIRATPRVTGHRSLQYGPAEVLLKQSSWQRTSPANHQPSSLAAGPRRATRSVYNNDHDDDDVADAADDDDDAADDDDDGEDDDDDDGDDDDDEMMLTLTLLFSSASA